MVLQHFRRFKGLGYIVTPVTPRIIDRKGELYVLGTSLLVYWTDTKRRATRRKCRW